MAHFVVINERGPNWDGSRSMREQVGWKEHAAFMNALADDHFVVLGGPLRDRPWHTAMLVVSAETAQIARDRLAEDPWMRGGILQNVTFDAWEMLLGELP